MNWEKLAGPFARCTEKNYPRQNELSMPTPILSSGPVDPNEVAENHANFADRQDRIYRDMLKLRQPWAQP